jgi:hypothetical protein
MSFSNRVLGIAFVLLICGCPIVLAVTFTVPLSLAEKTGSEGKYLSADFDFQTAFSHVDSVTLNFFMPNGYAGTGIAGGYFSVFSNLWMVVHSVDSPVTVGYFISPGSPDSDLAENFFQVPAGTSQQLSLYPPAIFFGDGPFDYPWPDFLFSGKGNVALTEVVDASSGFAPCSPPALQNPTRKFSIDVRTAIHNAASFGSNTTHCSPR